MKGNYSGEKPHTFKINKKSIKPTITAENKDYDGKMDANVSVTFEGLIDGETLEKDDDYTIDSATFKDANAGENKTVTATITLKDNAKTKNYTFIHADTNEETNTAKIKCENATINKKPITPKIKETDGTILSKIYDGTTDASKMENLDIEFEDLPTGVALTKGKDYTIDTAEFDNPNVGSNKKITVRFISLLGDARTNYAITTYEGVTTNRGEIIQANPSYKSPEKPLTAVFGDELSKLEEQLVAPEGVNGAALGGSWSFADKYGKLIDKNTILNEIGEQEYTAVFEPTDSNYQTARIKFKVNVTADTSSWGSPEVRTDGKTQYVDAQGKTSVEMTSGNLDENSILWLREESYDASAWYGIDLSGNAFDLDKGQRFYVQWLSPNDDDYQTYYSQLDTARKAEIEDNKGWIFLIGIENHESKTVQPRKPVKVYVQIGDDWDKGDLQGYYISSAQDEQVETAFVDNLAYPAGTDTFGIMTLSHFSPYFIYDKLTDDEKAAFDALTDEEKTQLDAAAKELAAQQNEKSDETSESKPEKNRSGSSAKTGDEIIYFTISGVSLMMTLALGLILNSKINRRKLDE